MIYPVLMAGGVGTRFWPLSTPHRPKQFLPLIHPKKSMFQLTLENLLSWDRVNKQNIWVVTHQNFKSLVQKQAPYLNSSHCLLEPMMRNTAPCIGWAAKNIFEKDSEAIMVVLPSDNWIDNKKKLIQDLKSAVHFVEQNPLALVTFGTSPTYSATGYGYIEMGRREGTLFRVKKFTEKPHLRRAEQMLKTKRYLWNGGMFVWKAKTILQELKKHEPSIFEGLQKLNAKNLNSVYKKFPAISIDYAVMERSKNVYVQKASFQWTDIGSWEGLSSLRDSRAEHWIQLDSKNCFVDVPHKTVATVGVSDLIVVDTPHGLLICHKKETQRVKEISKFLR
ncbi:MAG: mannose-1-phosphate guanylyltransferase [Deltaproteobacteria bacterium]|nr:mannose-1-phosphate guanylyltransferase [Deltaproteobacteria bacterium]